VGDQSHAVDTKERSKLGAHYTPRAYVQRLVGPTIMEVWRKSFEMSHHFQVRAAPAFCLEALRQPPTPWLERPNPEFAKLIGRNPIPGTPPAPEQVSDIAPTRIKREIEGMFSLLYVSRSTNPEPEQEREFQRILAVSVQRNLRAGITGALVYSGHSYAQVLESPEHAVSQVMGSIIVDRRHKEICISLTGEARQRSSPNWGMAQIASSTIIDAAIEAIRHASSDEELDVAGARLVSSMREGSSSRV
jgi:hypothetical protein